MLGIAERCILGFTGAAPTFPSLYNNFKRIVQTDAYVMIEIEMVHDARIVRMNSEHPPAEIRKWLGDSIGQWEGDTLVVDTTNFHPQSGVRGGSENAHVVERFTKLASGDVLYQFTVDDPSVWVAPWSGEYVWRASDERIWEYACHEGNYAMGNILRGARLLRRKRWRDAPPRRRLGPLTRNQPQRHQPALALQVEQPVGQDRRAPRRMAHERTPVGPAQVAGGDGLEALGRGAHQEKLAVLGEDDEVAVDVEEGRAVEAGLRPAHRAGLPVEADELRPSRSSRRSRRR